MSGNQDGPLRRWGRLALKESRETLRDRRTIITLVLMPLLVYPLLGVAFQKFLLTSFRPQQDTVYLVGVENSEHGRIVESFLKHGQTLVLPRYEPNAVRDGESGPVDPAPPDFDDEQSQFQIDQFTDVEAAVENGNVDFAVRLPKDVRFEDARELLKGENQIPFELVYRKGNQYAERGVSFAERCLEALNSDVRGRKLWSPPRSVPLHHVPAHPYRTELSEGGGGAAFSIAALVPLILILMTITGAVYPAIDLTAGERERGTLEMLVAAPVPRMGLLLAKYATVVLVATLTATVNLVSMTITILATGLGPFLFGDQGLSIAVVVQVFGLLVLFAMFFSAVLLAMTSFARSFKEAQAYLIPLMLVSIAPGVLSMIPDVHLQGFYIVIPLANIVLLSRDLILGTATPFAAAAVVLSTVVYAIAAIMIAARIFGTDAILYGSPGTWSELFRKPDEPAEACTPLAAVLSLAIAFPLCFLLRMFAGRMFGGTPYAVAASGVLTAAIFGGIPLVVAVSRRLRPRSAFSLRGADATAFLGAALLGLSLWPFLFELLLLARELEIVTVNEQLMQAGRQVVEQMRSASAFVVLTSFAVLPAVFEELFFRGLMLSALRKEMSNRNAIVFTAVAFAVFHVVVLETLAIERLFPSLILGLVLGWVCVRTGSLFPGVLLHAANNGLLLSLGIYEEQLAESFTFLSEEREHLPLWLLGVAAAIAAAGFALLLRSKPQSNEFDEATD